MSHDHINTVFFFTPHPTYSFSRSDPSNLFRDNQSYSDQNGIPDSRKTICEFVSAQMPNQHSPLNSQVAPVLHLTGGEFKLSHYGFIISHSRSGLLWVMKNMPILKVPMSVKTFS